MNLADLSIRQQKILKKCNISGKGLEIGPSFNPIAPKRAGFDIEIIDHLNREGLIEKYKSDPNTPNNIGDIVEDVDYVWDGRSYVELTGKRNYYDYIISSHLIEHVPDLIGHLQDCSMLLKGAGVYSLAIPYKYYTFDRYRPCTTVKDCINSYMQNNHSKGSIAEYYLGCVANRDRIAWEQSYLMSDYHLLYTSKDALNAQRSTDYLDIHQSVFTPASFALLINDLYGLEYIDFQIVELEKAEDDCEFYAVLKKNIAGCGLTNRMKLLQALEREVIEMYSVQAIKAVFQKSRLLKSQLELKNQISCKFAYCIDKISVNGCNLHKNSNIITLTREDTLFIKGWVFDKDTKMKAGAPKALYLSSGIFYYLATLQCRPDVPRAFGRSGTGENLGFWISIPACLLDDGEMHVEFFVILENGNYCKISTEYALAVKGELPNVNQYYQENLQSQTREELNLNSCVLVSSTQNSLEVTPPEN